MIFIKKKKAEKDGKIGFIPAKYVKIIKGKSKDAKKNTATNIPEMNLSRKKKKRFFLNLEANKKKKI